MRLLLALFSLAPLLSAQALSSSGLLEADVERPNPRPDVVVVVLDDVALSDADLVPTPNLDLLASQGVSFRRAYSMPLCSQTRFGLFFGVHRGTVTGSPCAPAAEETPPHSLYSLPKAMKGLGYGTALFGKWHGGSNALGPWELSPNLHGFDTWRAGTPSNVPGCGGEDYFEWTRVDDGVATTSTEYHTTAVQQAFQSWWETAEGPRFAFVAFQAPHRPFHVPPPETLPPGYPVPATNREMYEAMLVAADGALGAMLATIDLRTTYVIVLGDNGTPGSGRRPDQAVNEVKGSTFEDGVRVPCVVAGPKTLATFETDALVHTSDVLATVVELAGGEVPRGEARDSRSFVPCLTDPEATVHKFVFCDVVPTNGGLAGPMGPIVRDRCLVTPRYKLRRLGSGEELYDLLADPGEEHPLPLGDPAFAGLLFSLREELDRAESASL